MLKEMAGLGFSHAELSHGIRIVLVPGILRAVEEGVIKISSTHNFCPLPTGISHAAPNLFEPSAQDPREIDQWLRHTRRSIDFAAQVGAQVTVCHLGSVRFLLFNPGSSLREYARAHPEEAKPGNAAYQARLAKALAKMRKRMGPYWERVKESIDQVLAYAGEKKVRLGFENREKFEELPLDDDYQAFIEGLAPTASAGYWHDTGHADIKESMGLLEHRAHLQRMSPRLMGFHLHDVDAAGHDHQPIGDGHIDFNMVSGFWRPEHLLVLEFSPRLEVDEVARSKEKVEQLLKERGFHA